MKYDYYAHTSEMMGSLKALLRLLDIVQMFCMLEFSIPSDTLKDPTRLLKY